MPFYLILASKSDHKLSIILDCHKGDVKGYYWSSLFWKFIFVGEDDDSHQQTEISRRILVKNFKRLFKKTVTSLL